MACIGVLHRQNMELSVPRTLQTLTPAERYCCRRWKGAHGGGADAQCITSNACCWEGEGTAQM
eukprot:2754028-Pyramimonas_sp.AAC.1